MNDKPDSGTVQSAAFWEQQWSWWHRIAPPLRPAPEDIDLLADGIATWCADRGRSQPRAVLLGVTPEIACMRWPHGTLLLAVDRSRGMIQHVWPRTAIAGARALPGEWTALPFASGACDIATGDGCFSQMPYPQGYGALVDEIARALHPGGLFAMRAFIRPEPAESVQDLMAALDDGGIRGFHAFKWRLNMALQSDTATGVRLHDVWTTFMGLFGNPRNAARRADWPLDVVETIHAYHGKEARYTFPTLSELRASIASRFKELSCRYPGYEMGERCPTLLFEAT